MLEKLQKRVSHYRSTKLCTHLLLLRIIKYTPQTYCKTTVKRCNYIIKLLWGAPAFSYDPQLLCEHRPDKLLTFVCTQVFVYSNEQ